MNLTIPFSLFSVVSKQPLVDYYVKMKITNLSGKKVLLIPGDNDPPSGMPINANVIAMITKDVPIVEPNVPALQFAVIDAETRKQFMLINGTQIVTLRPVRNKNVIPINLVIGKPGASEVNCVDANSCFFKKTRRRRCEVWIVSPAPLSFRSKTVHIH